MERTAEAATTATSRKRNRRTSDHGWCRRTDGRTCISSLRMDHGSAYSWSWWGLRTRESRAPYSFYDLILVHWGNKNGLPVRKWKGGKFLGQERLKKLHLVQFECSMHLKLPVSYNFEVGRFPFSDYWTTDWGNKNGLPVWEWKRWKISSSRKPI